MIKNYFITAWRNLLRNKFFSFVNLSGLAIGLAAFILIALYVFHELNFDRYNQNANRIYRVVENLRTENELLFQSTSSPPMGPALQRDFPEVKSYVRFLGFDGIVRIGENTFHETDCYLADSTAFEIFTWPLLQGNPRSVLTEPYTAVLTATTTKKLFGNRNPVGEMINVDGEEVKVTGVMEDVPENSHFQVNLLISFSTWSLDHKRAETDAWFYNGFHTYLLLEKGKDIIERLRAKMPGFIDRNIEKGGMYYEDLPLQPLTEIYLTTPRSWENGKRGSINNIYILSIIAGFILMIACFNYINMATARATRRIKEVGLKKVLGAQRGDLIAQFLGESLMISILATLLGMGIAWLSLPAFNNLIEGNLHFNIFPNGYYFAGSLMILALLLGIFSGFYPALMISGFWPFQIFRPVIRGFFGHQKFRKVLVTAQFIISIMLVAGTLLIYDQLSMVRNQDLGFIKEETLILPFGYDDNIREHLEAVKNDLSFIDGVMSVSASATVPGESTTNLYTFIEMQNGKMSPTNINTNFVDQDFLPAYGIEILAGRNFSHNNKADDSAAFIINESAMKDFGWTPEEALGKKVDQQGRKGNIIGVTKNFHYRSLHFEVDPLLILLGPYYNEFSIKIHSDNIQGIVREIGNKWSEIAPDIPYRYSFLDEDFDRLYKADAQLGRASSIFSCLAIFVGCLGLLGLTSFSVERRFKEIGIRKVLGASVSNIIILISKEYVWLILTAFVIATPLTYFIIGKWLQNFTSQIRIGPLSFLVAGISVLGFALLTVSYLSVHAATTNPTVALREE